jgi:hypothetical protein
MKIKITWRTAFKKNRQIMNDDLCLEFYSIPAVYFLLREQQKRLLFMQCRVQDSTSFRFWHACAFSLCLVNCYFSPPLFCVYSVGDGAGAEILSEILIFKLGCMSSAASIPTLLPSPSSPPFPSPFPSSPPLPTPLLPSLTVFVRRLF